MDTLPEEILTLILFDDCYLEPQWKAKQRYASDSEGFRVWLRASQASLTKLRTLSSVSKVFRRICQPILYRRFEREMWSDADKRTKLFLRTLLENPRLAGQVEEVSLGKWDTSTRYVPAPPLEYLAKLYNEDLMPLCSMRSDVDADLRRGSEDAQIVLLLALCPNIQALDFTAGYKMDEESYLWKVLDQHWHIGCPAYVPSISNDKRLLPKLQYLEFRHWDTENCVSINQIRIFFNLPRLKHLNGYTVGLEVLNLPQETSCGVIHIHLDDCIWDVQGVSALLRACPNLETLELIAGDCIVGFCDLKFPALGAALRRYGTSLRSLKIDARGAWGYADDDLGGYQALLGSLKHVNRLEYLQLPLLELLDDELEIDDDDEDEDDNLTSPEHLSRIYTTLQRDILPDSVTHVLILDYFSSYGRKPRRPDQCIVYNGVDGKGKMRMHLCRGNGYTVDDDCTVVD